MEMMFKKIMKKSNKYLMQTFMNISNSCSHREIYRKTISLCFFFISVWIFNQNSLTLDEISRFKKNSRNYRMHNTQNSVSQQLTDSGAMHLLESRMGLQNCKYPTTPNNFDGIANFIWISNKTKFKNNKWFSWTNE